MKDFAELTPEDASDSGTRMPAITGCGICSR